MSKNSYFKRFQHAIKRWINISSDIIFSEHDGLKRVQEHF